MTSIAAVKGATRYPGYWLCLVKERIRDRSGVDPDHAGRYAGADHVTSKNPDFGWGVHGSWKSSQDAVGFDRNCPPQGTSFVVVAAVAASTSCCRRAFRSREFVVAACCACAVVADRGSCSSCPTFVVGGWVDRHIALAGRREVNLKYSRKSIVNVDKCGILFNAADVC